ncbi:hypothetical protein [Bradyrhizobium lupini]|uniref:hypothetical protein n=1 Tax=Rhizobium lupini TaxID=136996 RepID=UPI0034C62781
MRIAQTPQSFRFDVILEAHRRAAKDRRRFHRRCRDCRMGGIDGCNLEGDNMKLTISRISCASAAWQACSADIRTRTSQRRPRLRRGRPSHDMRRARAAHQRLRRPIPTAMSACMG